MNKQKYYRLTNILKTKCDYYEIFGGRSDGKSYAVKELLLEDAILHNKEFAYCRRWEVDLKRGKVEKYFADMGEVIKKFTKGEYDRISYYNEDIYLAKLNDKNKIERGKVVGHACALTQEEHYKSLMFPLLYNILLEEMITIEGYLANEADIFMSLVSTLLRRRKGRVFLVGNSLLPVSPYFDYFGIDAERLEQGSITLVDFHTSEIDSDTGEERVIHLAVEYCAATGNNTQMIFSNKMITSGKWQTSEHFHLPKSYNKYDLIYRLLVEHGKNFIVDLLVDRETGFPIVYIKPYIKEFDERPHIRRITTTVSLNPLHTPKLIGMELGFYDKKVVELWRQNKVAYSDNLTAEKFISINPF